jgi:hypothetical protein
VRRKQNFAAGSQHQIITTLAVEPGRALDLGPGQRQL